MDESSDLDALLDLMRRLPPQRTEENLAKLVELVPDLADDLLTSVDQPLKVRRDVGGREYLACDYNRDGDSYRSPWSNEYEPALEDGTRPSAKLRTLEVACNEAFDVYREMYFEGGISSVYLWDLDDGFAGVVLLKKVLPTSSELAGTWDSIHVFEASERVRHASYKLTSTVMLHLVRSSPTSSAPNTSTGDLGTLSLSGSMTRQLEQSFPLQTASSSTLVSSSHIPNLGTLVEDMEIKMRNLLQEVYFGKTRDVCNDLRSLNGLDEGRRRAGVQRELVGLLRSKAAPPSAPATAETPTLVAAS